MATDLNNFAYQSIINTAEGVLAESFSRLLLGNNDPLVNQAVECVRVPLLAGDVITSIVACSGAAGTLVTRVEMALLDAAGVRRGTTGDVKAMFTNDTMVTAPLGSPYTVPSDAMYYLAILGTATGQGPIVGDLSFSAQTDGPAAAYGTGSRLWGAMTAQTAIPATVTIGAPAASPRWLAVV